MKRTLIVLALVCFVITSAFAQYEKVGKIKGSVHDISATGTGSKGASPVPSVTEICIFCHTAHPTTNAANAAPLWNRANTTVTYNVYASTLFGDALTTTNQTVDPKSITGACLSCHDGTMAYNSVYDVGGVTTHPMGATATVQTIGTDPLEVMGYANTKMDTANWGANGKGSHPVHIDYQLAQTVNTQLVPLTTGANGATTVGGLKFPLFNDGPTGAGPMLECASCHAPHDQTVNKLFLRADNANASALCINCHQ